MRAAQPTLPNLLVIGAAKAGTTSLHSYLSLHPQIHMSKQKELAFFDTRLRWERGVDWYKSQFDASYPINGESSPQYSIHPRITGVPERIKKVLGTPKMIYVLRDPVDRILSNYTQAMDHWPETRRWQTEQIESEHALYLYGSSYFSQLSQYLKIFPRESILVLLLERLTARPKEALKDVYRFLGVDDTFWSDAVEQRLNEGSQKRFGAPWFESFAPPCIQRELRQPTWMPWKMRRALHWLSRRGGDPIRKPKIAPDEDLKLQDLLKADVAALRDFLGDSLPEWRAYA